MVSVFPDETAEAQKGYVTCLTPHSKHMAEQGQTQVVWVSAWALGTSTQCIIHNCPQITGPQCLLDAQDKPKEGWLGGRLLPRFTDGKTRAQQGKAKSPRLHRE